MLLIMSTHIAQIAQQASEWTVSENFDENVDLA